MITQSSKHIGCALSIVAMSVPFYCAANTVAKDVQSSTEWNNEQLVYNQDANFSTSSATKPDVSFTGYKQSAFQAKTSGVNYTWELSGLGDITVQNAALTSSATADNDPSMYQGVFKSYNMRELGYTTLKMHENGNITFSNNVHSTTGSWAHGSGLTQYCEIQNGEQPNKHLVISLEGNKNILFEGNKVQTAEKLKDTTARVYGGAINVSVPDKDAAKWNNPVTNIRYNEDVTFTGNSVLAESMHGAIAHGGAIYGSGWSIFDLSDNRSITISNNKAIANGDKGAQARGAGVLTNLFIVKNVSEVNISDNETEAYSENGSASATGSGLDLETLELRNNTSVTVKGNTSKADGKTASSTNAAGVTTAFANITGNESVEFKNNSAISKQRDENTSVTTAGGGLNAFCATIADNKKVVFRGNSEQAGDFCKLNAIYGNSHEKLSSFIDVSAPAGGTVEFYDPITVTKNKANAEVNFNKATEGVEGSGKGAIIFSAEHVAEDLAAAKGSAPTEAELEASRTSVVDTTTTQHGGLVQLKDDIIYKGKGYEAVADSDSVLHMKNAEMLHDDYDYDYDFIMNKNTTLAVEGHNKTSGNMVMKDGSAIDFAVTNKHLATQDKDGGWNFRPLITHLGEWTMKGTLNVTLSDGRGVHLQAHKRYALLDISAKGTQPGADVWNENTVVTTCPGGYAGYENYLWEGNVLYLVLDEDYYTPDLPALEESNRALYKGSRAFNKTVMKAMSAPDWNRDAKGWETDGKSGLAMAVRNSRNLWVNPYGATASFDSHNSIGGSDYNLYGIAAGAETELGRRSNIGVALGWDCGKLTPKRYHHIDQESVRLGLYGRKWHRTNRGNVLTLDWAASFGRTKSQWDSMNKEWTQNSFQIDLRGSHSKPLTMRTSFNKFIGVQYYTHGSDRDGDVSSSSMHNVRIEAGVGLSYALTMKATVYGEIALYGDVVRDNPTVEINGTRYQNDDTDRIGGSATMGVFYYLSPRWSLFANYTFEASEYMRAHFINMGVIYTF